ncbi:MAG TPA: glycosyltransferase family 4 protein [Chthoniobacteraceae bacterium]|jgi:UDP-glucose:(heptosyl)LPS alpha-1,3-glucosyltransferase|nr:glycosyltransferase family 4 protein [Chthoniobacteraceae bacterium]
MKFGLVRRGYSGSGGAERYLLRFAEALREAGHEAVLFVSPEWPADAWKGDMVRIEGSGPRVFADSLARIKPKERCDRLFSLERVWECDAFRAGDGVHAAWLERRRAFEPKWKGWFRASQAKHREILELERAVFAPSGARLIIANSNLVAGEISRHFQVSEDRLRVIPNGLPLSCFGDPSFPASPAVLFAGSGWERKGLRFAIQAINRTAPPAPLLIAGTGKRRGLPASGRAQFLGEIAGLRDLMQACEVFVLPTIYDPFSNACLEAMAAGLPVITTRANGFSEIMRAGLDGEILGRPDDIAGMAAAIEKWRARETAGSRAARVEYARQFTIARNVRETVEALLK